MTLRKSLHVSQLLFFSSEKWVEEYLLGLCHRQGYHEAEFGHMKLSMALWIYAILFMDVTKLI